MMKKLIILTMSILVLAGCAETKRRTGSKTTEERRRDSIAEYRRTHQHKYSTHYAAVKMYKMHEPDCPLCKEMRRKETVAIVDSMLRERTNNLNR